MAVTRHDSLAALIVVCRAVRDRELGLRALDEVIGRLELAVSEPPPNPGAVEAIREHRDAWVAANGPNPGNVRPRDAKLWEVVGGIPDGEQS